MTPSSPMKMGRERGPASAFPGSKRGGGGELVQFFFSSLSPAQRPSSTTPNRARAPSLRNPHPESDRDPLPDDKGGDDHPPPPTARIHHGPPSAFPTEHEAGDRDASFAGRLWHDEADAEEYAQRLAELKELHGSIKQRQATNVDRNALRADIAHYRDAKAALKCSWPQGGAGGAGGVLVRFPGCGAPMACSAFTTSASSSNHKINHQTTAWLSTHSTSSAPTPTLTTPHTPYLPTPGHEAPDASPSPCTAALARLQRRRVRDRRPEDIGEMTLDEATDEKAALKKEIAMLQNVYRDAKALMTSEDHATLRMLYARYTDLRSKLEGTSKSPHAGDKPFPSSLGSQRRGSADRLHNPTEGLHGSDLEEVKCPLLDPLLTPSPTAFIFRRYKALRHEKKVLQVQLHNFQETFAKTHGHPPSVEERQPIAAEYRRYKTSRLKWGIHIDELAIAVTFLFICNVTMPFGTFKAAKRPPRPSHQQPGARRRGSRHVLCFNVGDGGGPNVGGGSHVTPSLSASAKVSELGERSAPFSSNRRFALEEQRQPGQDPPRIASSRFPRGACRDNHHLGPPPTG
ncbi:hypothetical protein BDK51DRAFT_36837 [Blyttiomyces helicus]|uniref:FAM13A-like domain-containing protein n=1 Tax=Blyttiomyces helicus TaxID=388810 RepID=A0A4P9WI43_9FUNG|nr:hypothetical protein BDK51DRAFT_36837 [Blyttiomyces helicus]|eukprot:RKO92529.1 hypothetical protein BDK51DRAFT_36837 [Blyttiomyces helicus]